jgi:hypothetical protein
VKPDPKWLEILKNDDDRIAVFAACGLFLLAAHWGWIPHLAGWVIPLVWFGFLLFGCLTVGLLFLRLFLLLVEILFSLLAKRR